MSTKKLELKDIPLDLAIKKIAESVNTDPDLKIGYVSNIAMCFYDEYSNKRGYDKRNYVPKHIDRTALLKIANDAAERFIELWLDHPKK